MEYREQSIFFRSSILDPRSSILDPQSSILNPQSSIAGEDLVELVFPLRLVPHLDDVGDMQNA
jgi:hypothetical protein